MGIMSIIALWIFFSGVTGMLMYFVWNEFCKYGKNYLNSNVVYFTLKIVLVSYYVPVMFIILWIKDKILDYENSVFLFVTNIMGIVFSIAFVVMLFRFVKIMKKQYIRYRKLKRICKSRIPAECDINDRMKELCRKYKIRKKLKVYKSYGTLSPFTYGLFRQVIYLPAENVDDMFLDIFLTHELFHNKQGDYIWKPLSILMYCLHCFNPTSKYLILNIEECAETACDYKSCEQGGFSQAEYFMYLIDMKSKISATYDNVAKDLIVKNKIIRHREKKYKYEEDNNGGEDIKQRIDRMDENNHLKKNKVIVALLMVISILAGCVSMYVATYLMDKAYYMIFFSTVKKVDEENIVPVDNYDEETILLSEFESRDIVVNEMDELISTEKNGVAAIELSSDECGMSAKLRLNRGEMISILSSVEPENNEIQIGIIQPDGIIRYIDGLDNIFHDFVIKQDGEYRIYVYNSSDNLVSISISYMH